MAASGTITFAAGETSETVNVVVNGDATSESDRDVHRDAEIRPASP